jgi:hypothetical protein
MRKIRNSEDQDFALFELPAAAELRSRRTALTCSRMAV